MTSIEVTPANSSVVVGSPQQFSATGIFSDGSQQDITSSVTWASSDPATAGITSSGLATSLTIGRPKITATSLSLSGSTQLTIVIGSTLPAARFAYVINEADNSMSTYIVDSATGVLRATGYIPTGTNPADVKVDPRGKFLYVTNADDNTISGFSIDSASGTLSPISGSPFSVGTFPTAIGLDPSGLYAYVDNQGSVSEFRIDPATGSLSSLQGSPVLEGSTAGSITVDPLGRFIYVGNLVFAVDPSTGKLTQTSGSPTPGGTGLTISPDGKFAFAISDWCSSSNLLAFTLNPTNGALTEVAGSPFTAPKDLPGGVAVDPSGKFLYSANHTVCSPHPATGSASTFAIDASGALTAVGSTPSVPYGPFAIKLDPSGKFGYVTTLTNEVEILSIGTGGQLSLSGAERIRSGSNSLALSLGAASVAYNSESAYAANAVSNDVSMYTVDGSSGTLTANGATPAGSLPRGIALSPSGHFAYVANQASNNVSMYTIDPVTRALASVGTVVAGTDPTSVAVDPSSRFVYVGNASSNDVSMFTINASTGALTANGTISAGTTPIAVTVDPTGRYLFVANQGSGDVSMFSISPTSGALTSVGPFSVGISAPVSVGVDPSGRFFYVCSNINQLSIYDMLENNGATDFTTPVFDLVEILTAGTQATPLAFDPTGRFAYVGDVVSNLILTYAVDSNTGALMSTGSVAAGMYPVSISVDPSGQFVYVANQNSDNLSMYRVDSKTGTLTPSGTIAAGTQPISVVSTATMQ
jgi:6-phosphogluconolactonase (cycloisomerase 2 family)